MDAWYNSEAYLKHPVMLAIKQKQQLEQQQQHPGQQQQPQQQQHQHQPSPFVVVPEEPGQPDKAKDVVALYQSEF